MLVDLGGMFFDFNEAFVDLWWMCVDFVVMMLVERWWMMVDVNGLFVENG